MIRTITLLAAALVEYSLAQRSLVAPGAMTPGGGGGGGKRGGGWGVVGKWPIGFFVAGSSITDMNGLYIFIGERDDSLPEEGIMTWGNLGSSWTIANVDARTYSGCVRYRSWLHVNARVYGW